LVSLQGIHIYIRIQPLKLPNNCTQV